jgi:hypothetical protein
MVRDGACGARGARADEAERARRPRTDVSSATRARATPRLSNLFSNLNLKLSYVRTQGRNTMGEEGAALEGAPAPLNGSAGAGGARREADGARLLALLLAIAVASTLIATE